MTTTKHLNASNWCLIVMEFYRQAMNNNEIKAHQNALPAHKQNIDKTEKNSSL